MLSPTTRPSRPSASNGLTSSHASGAPSEPCLGASLRFLMLDRTTPMGRSCAGLPRCLCLLIFPPAFFLDLIENFSNPERSFRVLGCLPVGIELGCASLEGGGLPSSPFRSARRGHNSTKAAFLEAPL